MNERFWVLGYSGYLNTSYPEQKYIIPVPEQLTPVPEQFQNQSRCSGSGLLSSGCAVGLFWELENLLSKHIYSYSGSGNFNNLAEPELSLTRTELYGFCILCSCMVLLVLYPCQHSPVPVVVVDAL